MSKALFAASLLAALASSPVASAAGPGATGPASTFEQCEVWTALGRSLFGWGAKPADNNQFVIFFRPSGDTYVEQCPWSRLGVTPPALQKPNLDNVVFFDTPIFQDGGRTAVVGKTVRIKGNPGLFMQADSCVLKKTYSKWALEKCAMTLIT